jgi:hypothetical protein
VAVGLLSGVVRGEGENRPPLTFLGLSDPSPVEHEHLSYQGRKDSVNAVGSLDNDSDEDPEIEVSAVSRSCGISITHHAFPSKRQKMNPADEQVANPSPSAVSNIVPEATADDDQTPGEANPVEEKKRNQVRVSCILKWLNNHRHV